MRILFAIIILKRIFFDDKLNIAKLGFHLMILGLFMICLRAHAYNDVATRIVPLMIGFLSYYGHT